MDRATRVGVRGDVDDARGRGLLEEVEQEVRQQKSGEVVDLERPLKAVRRDLAMRRVDAGVIDQDVEPRILPLEFLCEDSTRSFAEEFKRKYPRLDVLINNAGVYTPRREVTPDGLERTFEVNYLSGFLLTHLLLDLLKKSAPSRIINVSSSAHSGGTIHFDDLQGEQRYGGFGAYGQSKLAQVLVTRELAQRLEGTGVTVNACHPGVIRTNLGMGGTSAVVRFVRMFFKTPEKGAETPIYLAVSPDVERVTGQYFANKHVREPSREAQDPNLARRLFDVSKELAHLSA